MSIKSILCIFGGKEKELGALDTSFSLAESYAAKVRVLHVSQPPSSYVGIYGEGVLESSHVIAAIEKENKELLERATQYVKSFSARHNVPLGDRNNVITNDKTNNAVAEFVYLVGDVEDVIAQQGRLSDIIVVGRGMRDPSAVYDSAIISAIFDTGRPVLLIPKGKSEKTAKWSCKNISLAWDGGLEAARAIYNSLPLLEHADKIQLLTARGNGEACDLEAEEGIIKYLQCHGICANGIIIAAGSRTPAEALLMRTKELESDLLVMGAYGHSRFREMIFGGITNHMLEAADIPLLLSH